MIDQSILQQHPKNVQDLVRFFDSSHLRTDLQHVVQPFEALASNMLQMIPSSAELVNALRKLLEAKDGAVRAHLHAVENNLQHILPGL